MRFEVPQFIEVEDKIFGPFTWKQFVYLAGGGGAAFVLYFTLPLFLFAMIGVPIVVLAAFLAFHQVNNRPFADFLESAVGYVMGTKLYLWRKQNPRAALREEQTPAEETPPKAQNLPAPTTNNIDSLSRRLEMEALEDNT